MNLSLRNRVTTSFVLAIVVISIISFVVFNFLDSLKNDIEGITVKSNQASLLTDDIKISAVSLLKYQKRLLINRRTPGLVEKIVNLCEAFTSQLHTLDSLYNDSEVHKLIERMLTYVDSLKLILQKATLFNRDSAGIASVEELSDKILEAFSEFQHIQYYQSVERDKKIRDTINSTKQHMMITLIIGFLGTIILGLVVPGKIALPFKKIKDAIRELQDCNFDVSIFYNQDDEIGEIAREMNKMIYNFKVFEELRANRISVEHRKFDALANVVKKPVLVADAAGKLIYMNSGLYSLLQVQSEDVIGKTMNEAIIPASIISSYEIAIKRRSKIENAEIVIPAKKVTEEKKDGASVLKVSSVSVPKNGEELLDESGKVVEKPKEEAPIFSGYANVIPIRGKESSLDYYLMVLSTEVFV